MVSSFYWLIKALFSPLLPYLVMGVATGRGTHVVILVELSKGGATTGQSLVKIGQGEGSCRAT